LKRTPRPLLLRRPDQCQGRQRGLGAPYAGAGGQADAARLLPYVITLPDPLAPSTGRRQPRGKRRAGRCWRTSSRSRRPQSSVGARPIARRCDQDVDLAASAASRSTAKRSQGQWKRTGRDAGPRLICPTVRRAPGAAAGNHAGHPVGGQRVATARPMPECPSDKGGMGGGAGLRASGHGHPFPEYYPRHVLSGKDLNLERPVWLRQNVMPGLIEDRQDVAIVRGMSAKAPHSRSERRPRGRGCWPRQASV